MDRRRAIARSLGILGAATPALLFAGAGDMPTLPLREARWLAPNTLFAGLTRQPAECLKLPSDPVERRRVEIGRIAFGAPLLLGGQAARAGLSCSSCHRNGRGNRDFLFPGLSGAAGTADVTSSLMSKKRGDGDVNPKPIPDLAAPAAMLKISRDPKGRALEQFIHGLVVEEFDGPEPAPAVLDGLAAYVRAIGPEACRGRDMPVSLAKRLEEAESAVALARRSDPATRRLLLAAARSALGAIDERFRIPGMEASRALLREADRELAAIRAASDGEDQWLRRWPARKRRLRAQEDRSLFSPIVLRRRLGSGARS